MVSYPAIARRKRSNANVLRTTTGFTARNITAQRGRAFIAEDGTGAGLVLVGHRRRLGRCGIVADSTKYRTTPLMSSCLVQSPLARLGQCGRRAVRSLRPR